MNIIMEIIIYIVSIHSFIYLSIYQTFIKIPTVYEVAYLV